jgi:beta-lactamase class A
MGTRARLAAIAVLFIVCPVPRAAGEEGLGAVLEPLIEHHAGRVAVAVRHLDTGEQYGWQADEPMPTASLIKLAVMVEVYQQAQEGKLGLDESVTLHADDKVPGSGILTTHFSPGASFALRDAVRLMIVFSDNTATNLVLDRIGIAATSERMRGWGFPHTQIHSKVFRRETSVAPERSSQFGLGSTTAAEMLGLLAEIHAGERIAADARSAMLDHLKHCDDRDKFSRLLPAGTAIAHKTGSLSDVRTDAGILYTPAGPVALCVLTAGNEDTSWRADNAGNLLCARVARAVYDYFSLKKD